VLVLKKKYFLHKYKRTDKLNTLAIFVTNMAKNKEIFAKNVKNKNHLKKGFCASEQRFFVPEKTFIY